MHTNSTAHSAKENLALETPANNKHLAAAMLATLGVVYGDIGTSPLYAFRECFHESNHLAANQENVLGVLSLIFWALMLVLSIKYVALVMRADNDGEGGILALLSLIHRRAATPAGRRPQLVILGLFGAALLYGDGMITPAISVLSAVEGLHVVTPVFDPFVIPITLVILITLFAVQRHGTARIGAIFGPVTLVWFIILALLGLFPLLQRPETLAALDPRHAVSFLTRNGLGSLWPLGAVFLAVTGAEALYADMGHFGAVPIRRTWFVVVLPCLLLNYFGQGALLLQRPEALENPFFHMVPGWALIPTVIMATVATVIASQAVISGAFSLTRQAVRLDYLPRLAILHTSKEAAGQIWVPAVNRALLLAALALVIAFGSSSALAAAYGIAVSTTMLVTTVLLYVVMRERWKWPLLPALAATLSLGAIDLVFLTANSLKISHGGWFPLLIGLLGYIVMSTWKRGRELVAERLREQSVDLNKLRQQLQEPRLERVPGTAVFLTRHGQGVPPTLLQNIRHNHVLHEKNIFLTLRTVDRPRIPRDQRLEIQELPEPFHRVIATYGYMESPNVLHVLARCNESGLEIDPETVTYFMGRETLFATDRPGMPLWRERLFAIMSRNAVVARQEFYLPSSRVVELGSRIEL